MQDFDWSRERSAKVYVESHIHLEPRFRRKKDWTSLFLKTFTFTKLTVAKLLLVYSSYLKINVSFSERNPTLVALLLLLRLIVDLNNIHVHPKKSI